MVQFTGILVTAAVITFVLGPPVMCFVAMRRLGRSWARIRIVTYSFTSFLYCVNAAVLFARGNHTGGWISGMIGWFAGKGAWQAWHAYRSGDYRPAYLREEAPTTASETSAE